MMPGDEPGHALHRLRHRVSSRPGPAQGLRRLGPLRPLRRGRSTRSRDSSTSAATRRPAGEEPSRSAATTLVPAALEPSAAAAPSEDDADPAPASPRTAPQRPTTATLGELRPRRAARRPDRCAPVRPAQGAPRAPSRARRQLGRATASSSPTRASTPTCSRQRLGSRHGARDRRDLPTASPHAARERRPAEFVRRADRRARWQSPPVRARPRRSLALLAALAPRAGRNHYRDASRRAGRRLRPALAAWCRARQCRIEAPRRIDEVVVESTALTRAAAQDAFVLSVTLRSRSG